MERRTAPGAGSSAGLAAAAFAPRRGAARASLRASLAAGCLVAASAWSAPLLAAGPLRLGVGVGAVFSDGGTGPAAAVYAATPLNDYFDVEVEGTVLSPRRDGEGALGLSGTGGLLYKFDVFEWVPYCGALFGYGAFRRGKTDERFGAAMLSVPFGLDYLWSRELAFGAEGRYQVLFRSPSPPIVDGTLWTAMLRAELRLEL